MNIYSTCALAYNTKLCPVCTNTSSFSSPPGALLLIIFLGGPGRIWYYGIENKFYFLYFCGEIILQKSFFLLYSWCYFIGRPRSLSLVFLGHGLYFRVQPEWGGGGYRLGWRYFIFFIIENGHISVD